jgi:hypothetical protein
MVGRYLIIFFMVIGLTLFNMANAEPTGINKTIEDVNNAIQNFKNLVFKIQQQWIDDGCIPVSYNDEGIVESWENC